MRAASPVALGMAAFGVLGIFGGEALCLLGPLKYETAIHWICHTMLYAGVVCVAGAAVAHWGARQKPGK